MLYTTGVYYISKIRGLYAFDSAMRIPRIFRYLPKEIDKGKIFASTDHGGFLHAYRKSVISADGFFTCDESLMTRSLSMKVDPTGCIARMYVTQHGYRLRR